MGRPISPESLDAVEAPSLPILVDGDWRDSEAEEAWPVLNPAHGTVLTRVPLCPPDEVDQAVRSAARAWPAWREVPVAERVQVLFRFKRSLEEHRDDLARLVATEGGALLAEARAEVGRGIEAVDLACALPSLLAGEASREAAGAVEARGARFPLGVVAGLCPYDFPALFPLWTVPLALGAGNAVVLKPSELAPMTAVRLAGLLVEAGLPAGVLALVHGGPGTVDALLDHPDLRAASFAGPGPEARRVRARAAAGKRVQAWAAPRNHLVVMPDADLDLAARTVAGSAFGGAGRGLAGSVLVPVGDVAGPLLERLAALAGALRPGDPLDEASGIGPLIRAGARERAVAFVERALADGARLVADGRAGLPGRGFFLGPTVLDRVRPETALGGDQAPGPVLSTVRAGSLEEALALLSGPGGASSIFTRSGEAAWRFRARAGAAAVGVNLAVATAAPLLPFLAGDPRTAGLETLRLVTDRRVVAERW